MCESREVAEVAIDDGAIEFERVPERLFVDSGRLISKHDVDGIAGNKSKKTKRDRQNAEQHRNSGERAA